MLFINTCALARLFAAGDDDRLLCHAKQYGRYGYPLGMALFERGRRGGKLMACIARNSDKHERNIAVFAVDRDCEQNVGSAQVHVDRSGDLGGIRGWAVPHRRANAPLGETL